MGGLHPERIVMSRNLVVCCDGTWSDADKMKARERTNVWRIYDAVAGVERETKFYIAGVGTKNLVDKFFLGGLFGVGVGAAICKAYGWLAKHYRPGDRIFLFGFSRGAFTARSLAGFIGGRGLNGELAALPDKTFAKAVAREYDLYRAAAKVARPAPKIHFLGVFETVGKLGIPDQDFKGVNRRDKPENYEFHDTRLGPQVTHARQALSIDDARARYMPVLWTEKRKGSDVERPIYDWTGPGGRTVKQLWFSGKHSDVGGGANPGVTDVPQRWMLEEASAVGLVVRDGYLDSLKNPQPPAKIKGRIQMDVNFRPRSVPLLAAANVGIRVHESVLRRRNAEPNYWKTALPGKAGASFDVARLEGAVWQRTGLWLEGGKTYVAESDNALAVRYLQGYVANGGNPKIDGTWAEHQQFKVNVPFRVEPDAGGYAYFKLARRPTMRAKGTDAMSRFGGFLPVTLRQVD